MNVGQLVQALRRDGELTMRDAFLRFHEVHPDILGPPGRAPIIDQIRADSRIAVQIDKVALRQ